MEGEIRICTWSGKGYTQRRPMKFGSNTPAMRVPREVHHVHGMRVRGVACVAVFSGLTID